MKTAVILFNLGGPDSQKAVRPFLYHLFSDPAIISLPSPFRQILAWAISSRREKKAQKIYEKIGGKSPILENTQAQGAALEKKLGKNYRVFVCMRYWHPRAAEIVTQVKEYAPEKIILLPLYPQFSTTTSGSSMEEWKKEAKRQKLDVETKEICCYHDKGGFIRAHAALINDAYHHAAKKGRVRLLFSAHGLPQKIIDKGDPYQWQVEQTAQAVAALLNIDGLDWRVCYQSKVGPLEWIGPATEDEIKTAADEGDIALIVVPIAFVSDHSETLVELDMDYAALAKNHGSGVKGYFRVPALHTHPLFIQALKELCEKMQGKNCPEQCSACPCI